MKALRILVMLFALSIVFSGAVWSEVKELAAKVDPDGVQRVQMLAGSYFFDPNRVVVKANVPVELTVRKEGGLTPHNIVLEAPEAGISFKEELSTDPVVIKFTPTKPGEYSFYCDKAMLFFKSHRERGMEGVLVAKP